jgi:hypothetical protein
MAQVAVGVICLAGALVGSTLGAVEGWALVAGGLILILPFLEEIVLGPNRPRALLGAVPPILLLATGASLGGRLGIGLQAAGAIWVIVAGLVEERRVSRDSGGRAFDQELYEGIVGVLDCLRRRDVDGARASVHHVGGLIAPSRSWHQLQGRYVNLFNGEMRHTTSQPLSTTDAEFQAEMERLDKQRQLLRRHP